MRAGINGLVMPRSAHRLHRYDYLADDILFAKNGVNLFQPWMLTTMGEMKGFYPRRVDVDIRFYSRKDL